MDGFGENQALLTTDLNSENTVRYRLTNRDEDSRSEEDSCQSEEWWSDSSSCSSCDSDICSVVDWQSEVNPLGELMYIESLFSEIDVNDNNDRKVAENQEPTISKHKTKKISQNKLIRLIRRRNSGTRRSTKKKVVDTKDTASPGSSEVHPSDSVSASNASNNKVTFSEWPGTELQTVHIKVFGENLGRRASLCESLLGLGISTFPDKLNLMIAHIVPNTETSRHNEIKIGDWLYSINGNQVTINNIDNILKLLIPPVEVTLGLQRITSDPNTGPTSSQNNRHQSEFVKSILSSNNTLKLLESNKSCLFSVMYLSREAMAADDEEISPDQGIIYCYPPSPDVNTLYKIRGAFITLHCLMKDVMLSQHTSSEPVSSSVYLNENLIHIIYCSDDQNLFLLCVPHEKCTLADAEMLTSDIVRCLKFKYQTLTRCFKLKDNIPLLEQFFSMILSSLYSSPSSVISPQFEQLFPAAHWVPLPRDAQMQIDDALSELEANDFGSYINNNHGCQRLYSVIGTCLFYKGYLLSSHLARQDLVDVNSWCRQRGLLRLTSIESLANLVSWHEVFPASCNRGLPPVSNNNSNDGLNVAGSNANCSFPCPPNARWFLLIVGQGNSMLAVLLEAGGCSMEAVGVVGPDIYYVQQAQVTLSHIHKIGVPLLADKWLHSKVRPQIVSVDYDYCNKTSPKRVSTDNSSNISQQSRETSKSCENLQQSKLNLSQASSASKLISTSSLTSTGKHRNSPDNSINLIMPQPPNNLQRTACPDEISEDSTRSSVVSDDVVPILGRRAEREREKERAAATSDSNSHSRLSDSDFSDDSDWEPRRTLYGSRSLDMLMDLNKTKFSNTVPIIPSSLLAGKQNSLFHYVQLDKLEGVLLSPPTNKESTTPLMNIILEQFRSSAQSIHALLQNTVKFKKLNAQEIHESRINKSLVAIKEYGMLFEAELEQNKKSTAAKLNFWVIGRLFFIPHAKEVYVCYEESSPQNMVEIAFRLALSASG